MITKQVKHLLQQKSKTLFTVSPDMLVYDAIKMMVDKNLGALLVLKDGKFEGMFTERDYTRKVIVKGRSSKEITVGEIMESKPITITSEDSINDCLAKMTGGVRYLPVLDKKELIGVVSIGDLVKFIIEEQKYIIDNLQDYIQR
ncbi:MAG: CBS domain-containing protein [bacterium]|nr:CBS domain-containing protein [bacterium]